MKDLEHHSSFSDGEEDSNKSSGEDLRAGLVYNMGVPANIKF